MIEIERTHDNLNIFRHFSGDHGRENNVTRALLIALTRSPYSLVLLIGFLGLLADKCRAGDPDVVEKLRDFLGVPDRVEVSMQQGVANVNFLSDAATEGVLVEIAPGERGMQPTEGTSSVPAEEKVSGIVDGIILLEKADRVLALVIESKLYGLAGDEQIRCYKEAMAKRLGRSPQHVQISWDEVAALTEALPEAAQWDPIVSDFLSLLREYPHLVSYPRISESDFRQPATLDMRLRRLCERLGNEEIDGMRLSGFPERKKGGLDYDLKIAEPQGLKGNLGVACWEEGKIASKLVVGSRTYWETSSILERAVPSGVEMCLAKLSRSGRFHIDVHVRVFFHKFDQPWCTLPRSGPDRGDVLRSWPEAVELAKLFHRRVADDPLLAVLARHLPDSPDSQEVKVIERLRGVPEQQRPKLFSAFTFYLERNKDELVRADAEEQLRLFREDLQMLARLLNALSS
jgi:hypothetical protein